MSREKREFIRIPVDVEFSVQDGAGEHGLLFFAGRNVSIGGAFLSSDILFDPGTLLFVRFTLPDEEKPIQADAVVAWVSVGDETEAGMGVRFEAMGAHSQRAIERFVRRTHARA